MSTHCAIFDCDGTLVDGQAGICEAMEVAFAEAALPAPDRHDVRRIVGLSLPQAVRLLAPEASPEAQAHAVEAYKLAYRTSRLEQRLEEPLFDGMAELLHSLKDAGWQLAVATGKSDRGLNACLGAHGLLDLFSSLQTADRHPSKPHPAMLEAALVECGAEPRHAVMVGDTSFDMAMASAAGVRALGVDWGYHTAAELHEAGASAIAQSSAQLGEMIVGRR